MALKTTDHKVFPRAFVATKMAQGTNVREATFLIEKNQSYLTVRTLKDTIEKQVFYDYYRKFDVMFYNRVFFDYYGQFVSYYEWTGNKVILYESNNFGKTFEIRKIYYK